MSKAILFTISTVGGIQMFWFGINQSDLQTLLASIIIASFLFITAWEVVNLED